LLVVSVFTFGLVIPMLLYKTLGQEAFDIFPDARGAIAVVFFGWVYAGVPVLLGIGVRKLALRKR
jgi:hypothetical protein